MSERDVLFRLKAVNDPANKAAFAALAKDSGAAYQTAATGAYKASKASNDLAKIIKAEEKYWADQAKAVVKAEKEKETAFQRAQKAAEQSAKVAAKAAKDQETAQQRAQQAAQTATAKVQAANRSILEGSKQSLEGITQLARGFVLLGVASEKDLEKAVRVLAKFEAGVQVIKGTINLIQGLSKAYQGYRTAVMAAAAAQTALAAAESMSGKAAVAGAAAKGAAGVAGAGGAAVSAGAAAVPAAGGAAVLGGAAIAALAAVVVAAKLIYESFTGAAKQTDSWTYKIAEAEVGVFNFVAKLAGFDPLGDKKTERMAGKLQAGRTDRMDRSARLDPILAAQQAARERNASASQEANRFRLGAEGGNIEDIAAARGRLNAANRGVRSAGSDDSSQIGAARERTSALLDLKKLEEERLQIAREATKTAIDGAKEELGLKMKQLEQARDVAKTEQSRLLSSQQKLAGLNPLEAAEAKKAFRAQQSGQNLSRKQAELLRGLGVGDEKFLQGQDAKRVKSLGLEEVLAPQRQAVAAAERRAQRIEASVQVNQRVVVSLEREAASITSQISEEIARLVEEANTATARQLRLEMERQAFERTAREASAA